MKKQFRIINKGKGQLVLSTANLEEVADPSDIVVYIDEQVETRQPKVAGKSLVLDTEITKLINLDNTKDIDKAVSTPQENRIQEVVGAQITNSTALTDPTIAIVPTGNVHILGVGPGTYTYWGNQTVPANNIATLRRIGGVFSMSLTPITIPTSKSEAWTNVAGYATDVDRTHLGKLWKSNAATATTDIPGISSKWVEVLSGYLEQKDAQITAVLTNVSSYIQNAAYTGAGVYNPVSSYRAIVDYPTVAGKKIKILGLGSGSKNGIFKNASDVIVGSVFSVNSNTIYTVPATATKACFTLVGGADPAGDVAYSFYLGDTDADFNVTKINSFPVYDVGAFRKEETYSQTQAQDAFYSKSVADLQFNKKIVFPYFDNSQINTPLLNALSKAIKEIYVPNYDNSKDYLLSVFRIKQDLSGTITTDIRIVVVTAGTTTILNTYQFNLTGTNATNYNIGDGLQILELKEGALTKAYMLLDWKDLTAFEGQGYGNVLQIYKLSKLIGSFTFNTRIQTALLNSKVPIKLNVYSNNAQITSSLMIEVNNAIEEIYIPDYSDTFDYLLSVFRFKQSLSSIITIDVRVAQVQKGTSTLVKYYQFSITGQSAIDYIAKREIIQLTNGGFILLDWTKITSGTGYGELSTFYLLSTNIANPLFTNTIKGVKNTYNKTEGDSRYALKQEIGTSDSFYTKAQSDGNFASKTSTETQLSTHTTQISDINNNVNSIDADIVLVKNKLDDLVETPPAAGAITGNNVFTGVNTFVQPIKSVAAVNDDEVIRKGEYKQTLNRFVNAEDFGFKPTATATENVTALNNALNGGNKTVVISKAGIYEMNGVAYIDDNTEIIFAKGVTIKKVGSFMAILINRGALTHSYNSNITVKGLSINCNLIDSTPALTSPLYGLRGHVSFLCVRNLFIYDFKCTNYNTPQWALHVCSFNNFILDGFECRGNKDGVHLGRGDGFLVKNGICETFDDAIALNAHDYASCNPEIGDIKNGVIENVVDVYKPTTTGYFSRILLGAWVNWYLNMPIRNGDAVTHNGKVYRAIGVNTTPANNYTSQTEPTLTTFDATQADTGGFTWKLFQNDAIYSANIFNVEYRKIQTYDARVFINFEIDSSGTYNRSLHPDVTPANYPYCKQLKINDSFLKESTSIINAGVNFDIEINNVYGHKAIMNFPTVNDLTGISNVLINNCDFKTVVGNALAIGSNVFVKIRDCKHNGFIPMTCSGRLDSNENLESFLNITPQKGDFVKVANVPYYRSDSAWVSQL